MNKIIFFKELKKFISLKDREGVSEGDECWKAGVIALITFHRHSFPHLLYRELLAYLYKVRTRFDWRYKRQFGMYPSEELVWGYRLTIKNGVPVNLL